MAQHHVAQKTDRETVVLTCDRREQYVAVVFQRYHGDGRIRRAGDSHDCAPKAVLCGGSARCLRYLSPVCLFRRIGHRQRDEGQNGDEPEGSLAVPFGMKMLSREGPSDLG